MSILSQLAREFYDLCVSWLPAPYQIIFLGFIGFVLILFVFRIVKIVLDALPFA